jgi:hypothetical protein
MQIGPVDHEAISIIGFSFLPRKRDHFAGLVFFGNSNYVTIFFVTDFLVTFLLVTFSANMFRGLGLANSLHDLDELQLIFTTFFA